MYYHIDRANVRKIEIVQAYSQSEIALSSWAFQETQIRSLNIILDNFPLEMASLCKAVRWANAAHNACSVLHEQMVLNIHIN